MRLDKIEHRLADLNAVGRDDLATASRATLQHVLKHALLGIERLEELRAGVQPDLADIASL